MVQKKIDIYLDYINDYIDKSIIKEIKLSALSRNFYLDLYLDIETNDLTPELFAQLHCLSYDNKRLNEKNDFISSDGLVRGIFLDKTDKPYNLYNVYGLGESMKPEGLYNHNINDLDSTKKEVYDKLYNYLINTIHTDEENSKIITDSFAKFSYYYINNVKSITHHYSEKEDKYTIYINNYTKNENLLRFGISIKNISGKYEGSTISLLMGSSSAEIDSIKIQ